MFSYFRIPYLCLFILGMAVSVSALADEEEGIPTFRNTNKRETKEFVTRVGRAIIKAARSKPQKIELKDYSYSNPKPSRNELNLKMVYFGAVTKVKFDVEITVLLDVSDQEKREVLNIRYKDSNKSPVPYSEKKVQELIKKMNR